MKNISTKVASLILLVVSFNCIADASYNTKIGFFKSDHVIGGYDVVAYFTDSAAVEGDEQFKHEWNNSTWLFSSEKNKQLFVESPEKYAPQYGGYCAWAVANDKTAKIDPEQFSIIDGKLYLNYNAKIQKKWKLDTPQYIEDGNTNWPNLLEDLLN